MNAGLSRRFAAMVCLGFIALASGCATGDRSAWRTLQEDSYNNGFSYDAASIEQTSSNTVKVMANSNGAKYLYEIDCKAGKVRIIDRGAESSQWSDVATGSADKLLYDELCR
ncbi:MAG TPA: hypothetical protein VK448_01470 [Dissulfurispiraceae bacterium]|nr:hypothetical protein [Dissulfurispiraceae bacterium]